MPRQCGIATFSADLTRTLADLRPELVIDTIAMTDKGGYDYPPQVAFDIPVEDRGAYRESARRLNRRGYSVLSVQHEYGIFGGASGSYLMDLLREAEMPIVTTLHTVLRDPSPSQREVMDELLQLSERVIVMSSRAVELLVEVHQTPESKIDLIHHGIPAIEPSQANRIKSSLGINGPMILTFGLLSPDKGIQFVIEAMPKIVAAHPGATYVVVGATHPHVRESAGEAYREGLVSQSFELGVADNVRFIDHFVPTSELVEYLAEMDYYVTPYLNPQQITSGTLAYSVGAGKVVISTPYCYAEELLAERRGLLVPFRDSAAIADAVIAMEHNQQERTEMGRLAAAFGKQMLWPEVGKRYLATFEQAQRECAERLRIPMQNPQTNIATPLPKLRLSHLSELSDDTGILQHATFTIPNRSEGYCVDDNARALLLTAYLESQEELSPEVALLQSRYLSFVTDAWNPASGRFRNFFSYQRTWLEESGSEDSHGRALWALGAILHRSRSLGRREAAKAVFEAAAPALYDTTSPRTWAYGILAADEYLHACPHEYWVQSLIQKLAGRLLKCYEANQSEVWPWFEQSLSYANARLPQALIIGANVLGNKDMLTAGVKSLTWLMRLQSGPDDVFAPIGTNGGYKRGGDRNMFDQQPIEAWASLSACLTASRAMNSNVWRNEADRAFRWFLGGNMLNEPLAEVETGGCHDALHVERVNRNQGAESTLAYLCSLLEMQEGVAPDAPATVGSHELK